MWRINLILTLIWFETFYSFILCITQYVSLSSSLLTFTVVNYLSVSIDRIFINVSKFNWLLYSHFSPTQQFSWAFMILVLTVHIFQSIFFFHFTTKFRFRYFMLKIAIRHMTALFPLSMTIEHSKRTWNRAQVVKKLLIRK